MLALACFKYYYFTRLNLSEECLSYPYLILKKPHLMLTYLYLPCLMFGNTGKEDNNVYTK